MQAGKVKGKVVALVNIVRILSRSKKNRIHLLTHHPFIMRKPWFIIGISFKPYEGLNLS